MLLLLFFKYVLITKSDIPLRVVNQNKIVFHELAQEIPAFIACEERKRGKRNQMDVLWYLLSWWGRKTKISTDWHGETLRRWFGPPHIREVGLRMLT